VSANAKPPARYSRVPRFVLCAIGPIQPTSRNGVGRAALAKIVQASIPKALRRFVRFTRVKTLKPGSAAAVWAPDVGPPRETLTPTPTWTGPPSRTSNDVVEKSVAVDFGR